MLITKFCTELNELKTASGHAGYNIDLELARQVKEVDLVVGGIL